MKEKLDIEEIRSIEIDILKKVAEFCDDNSISYFLCAGTMLGAVRHKGFIPWDDDIDIMMPRPDYDKFIKLFDINGLRALNYVAYPKYKYPFIKVEDLNTILIEKEHDNKYNFGVNIDVFPIDGFPNNDEEVRKHIDTLNFYRMLLSFKLSSKINNNNIIKKIVVYMVKCIYSTKYINRKITEVALRYPFGKTKLSGLAVWGYKLNEVCPTNIYNKKIDVEFEGHIFKSVADYDTYLTTIYGDYMELPPEEERVSNHNFVAYRIK